MLRQRATRQMKHPEENRAKQLVEGSRWLIGLKFLWESGPCKPENMEVSPLQESDPKVKKEPVERRSIS